MNKILLSLFVIFLCVGCHTKNRTETEDMQSYSERREKAVFWDSGSIKSHLYYHDYKNKCYKFKRESLPVETQDLFIKQLHKEVSRTNENVQPETRYSDQHFLIESIYDYVTRFDDWGIGVLRRRCSRCLHNTILIYYISPQITWQGLTGRAGYLCICPNCLTQYEFDCTFLN